MSLLYLRGEPSYIVMPKMPYAWLQMPCFMHTRSTWMCNIIYKYIDTFIIDFGGDKGGNREMTYLIAQNH